MTGIPTATKNRTVLLEKQRGLEIDLVIDRNQRLFPLETKASATLLPGHAKALNKWRDLAGKDAAGGVIVANIETPIEVSGCRAISWKYALYLNYLHLFA